MRPPLSQRIGLIAGIFTGVIARHVDTGISGREELLIVVVGSLGAMAIAGLVGYLWARWHSPRLVVECGSHSLDFDRELATHIQELKEMVGDKPIVAAYEKCLRIRETRGFMASGVRARIVDIRPPNPRFDNQRLRLQWSHGGLVTDIPPYDTDTLILQTLLWHEDGSYTVAPTKFDHQSPLELDVELYVGERKRFKQSVGMQFAWPGLLLMMSNDDGTPPSPFPYPAMRRVSKRHWWKRTAKP